MDPVRSRGRIAGAPDVGQHSRQVEAGRDAAVLRGRHGHEIGVVPCGFGGILSGPCAGDGRTAHVLVPLVGKSLNPAGGGERFPAGP